VRVAKEANAGDFKQLNKSISSVNLAPHHIAFVLLRGLEQRNQWQGAHFQTNASALSTIIAIVRACDDFSIRFGCPLQALQGRRHIFSQYRPWHSTAMPDHAQKLVGNIVKHADITITICRKSYHAVLPYCDECKAELSRSAVERRQHF
jgi:hypothetical protein